MAGYGFKDGYNIGIGARAGKDGLTESLKQIYIGGVFAYHLGKSEGEGDFRVTARVWYLGGDIGYNIPFEGQPFSIRASSYLGIATLSATVNIFGFSETTSNSEFMIAPGATFYFRIGSDLTFGADARYFIVKDANALVVNATIGKSF